MAMKHVELIQNLVNHIEANLAEDINIAALADSCWISSWHFQRLFKSLVGDTLGGYVRGRRLTAAARLLLETRKGIIDIALDVGFTTPEAFSRSFKAYFKQTPKAFRAQKPQVFLTEKPLLTMALFEHISQDIQREPEILVWPALNLVGFETMIPSPFAVDAPYCSTLFESWQKLITTQNEIPNRLSPNFYGMTISPSGQFTEPELRYMAGTPVESFEQQQEGMATCQIPSQLVARFDVFDVSADTVGKTIDYIYGYWLPNSGYRRGLGNDYEFFEEIATFDRPIERSKYVIPLAKDC